MLRQRDSGRASHLFALACTQWRLFENLVLHDIPRAMGRRANLPAILIRLPSPTRSDIKEQRLTSETFHVVIEYAQAGG
jgi:hypothetical protein